MHTLTGPQHNRTPSVYPTSYHLILIKATYANPTTADLNFSSQDFNISEPSFHDISSFWKWVHFNLEFSEYLFYLRIATPVAVAQSV
jgi:hypothetical protein